SRALLPGARVEYTCRDLPLLCEGGREALPWGTFVESDDACRGRAYDLVLASSSLQYFEDWKPVAALLAELACSYLFITRTPVALASASFVVVQRPYACGYDTEYLGWVFNRDELIDTV